MPIDDACTSSPILAAEKYKTSMAQSPFVSLRMEIVPSTKENQLDGDSFLVDDKTPTLSGISRPLQAMFLDGGAAKLHRLLHLRDRAAKPMPRY